MDHPDQQPVAALRLKQETLPEHQALEARLLPYLEGITDADAYAQLLRAFYAFYHSVEEQVARQLPAHKLPHAADRRKSGWLLDDLAALGDTSVPPALPPETTPRLASEAAAWGALYVLEGSTLGGRIICRMLEKQVPGLPLRFFSGYGPQTGPFWTSFLEALEGAARQLPYPEIRQGAAHTFQTFDLWLEQLPVMSKAV